MEVANEFEDMGKQVQSVFALEQVPLAAVVDDDLLGVVGVGLETGDLREEERLLHHERTGVHRLEGGPGQLEDAGVGRPERPHPEGGVPGQDGLARGGLRSHLRRKLVIDLAS